jgi:hypothetical protein
MALGGANDKAIGGSADEMSALGGNMIQTKDHAAGIVAGGVSVADSSAPTSSGPDAAQNNTHLAMLASQQNNSGPSR